MVTAIDDAIRAEGFYGPNPQVTEVLTQLDDSSLVSRQRLVHPPDKSPPPLPPPPLPQEEKSSRSVPIWAIAAFGVLTLVIVLFFVFRSTRDPGLPTPEGTDFIAGQPTELSGETAPPTNVPVPTEDPTVLTPTDPPTAITEPGETAVPIPTDTQAPTATSLPPTEPPTTTPDLGPETIMIGQSVRGAQIEAVRLGDGEKSIVMIGGLHAGAVPGSVSLAEQAIRYFQDNLPLIPNNATLYIIPSVSLDSPYSPGELEGRLNANGVDLNRNWDCRWIEDAKWRGNVIPGSGGAAPFSEPETQALRNFIEDVDAKVVVFWEARATNGLTSPGSCSSSPLVSNRLAQVYGNAAGYEVADFEDVTNQEINGDGTNWLDSQNIPAISVLLPDYTDMDWNSNLAGISAVLREYGQ
jgi:hypothetical protein